jgi:predicted nucleic acid-binding Zn ribbon protein
LQKIDQILKTFIRKSSYKKRLEEIHALVVWPRVVGETISRQSKPLRIKEGILFVKVEHAVWKHELYMQKTTIIKKLNRYLEKNIVKDIRFQ